jgi:hypothetical protein
MAGGWVVKSRRTRHLHLAQARPHPRRGVPRDFLGRCFNCFSIKLPSRCRVPQLTPGIIPASTRGDLQRRRS